jgi:hypothetical protein
MYYYTIDPHALSNTIVITKTPPAGDPAGGVT